MQALIYQPAKTATQSGRANTRQWRLEFDQEAARRVEPLMGWTASRDMRQQLSLSFDSHEDAVAFCERHGIPYRVKKPQRRKVPIDAVVFNQSYVPVSGRNPSPRTSATTRYADRGRSRSRRTAKAPVAQLDRAADF